MISGRIELFALPILLIAALSASTDLWRGKVRGILDRGILRLGGQLEKDLKTGRASIDLWEN